MGGEFGETEENGTETQSGSHRSTAALGDLQFSELPVLRDNYEAIKDYIEESLSDNNKISNFEKRIEKLEKILSKKNSFELRIDNNGGVQRDPAGAAVAVVGSRYFCTNAYEIPDNQEVKTEMKQTNKEWMKNREVKTYVNTTANANNIKINFDNEGFIGRSVKEVEADFEKLVSLLGKDNKSKDDEDEKKKNGEKLAKLRKGTPIYIKETVAAAELFQESIMESDDVLDEQNKFYAILIKGSGELANALPRNKGFTYDEILYTIVILNNMIDLFKNFSWDKESRALRKILKPLLQDAARAYDNWRLAIKIEEEQRIRNLEIISVMNGMDPKEAQRRANLVRRFSYRNVILGYVANDDKEVDELSDEDDFKEKEKEYIEEHKLEIANYYFHAHPRVTLKRIAEQSMEDSTNKKDKDSKGPKGKETVKNEDLDDTDEAEEIAGVKELNEEDADKLIEDLRETGDLENITRAYVLDVVKREQYKEAATNEKGEQFYGDFDVKSLDKVKGKERKKLLNSREFMLKMYDPDVWPEICGQKKPFLVWNYARSYLYKLVTLCTFGINAINNVTSSNVEKTAGKAKKKAKKEKKAGYVKDPRLRAAYRVFNYLLKGVEDEVTSLQQETEKDEQRAASNEGSGEAEDDKNFENKVQDTKEFGSNAVNAIDFKEEEKKKWGMRPSNVIDFGDITKYNNATVDLNEIFLRPHAPWPVMRNVALTCVSEVLSVFGRLWNITGDREYLELHDIITDMLYNWIVEKNVYIHSMIEGNRNIDMNFINSTFDELIQYLTSINRAFRNILYNKMRDSEEAQNANESLIRIWLIVNKPNFLWRDQLYIRDVYYLLEATGVESPDEIILGNIIANSPHIPYIPQFRGSKFNSNLLS